MELRALTLELDKCLSRLAIVKPSHLAQLSIVHMTEYVTARECLRIRHFHLFTALLPRRRNPATLSRSSNAIRRDRGERLRLCAAMDLWCLELWRLRCPRVTVTGWRRWRRNQRLRDWAWNRFVGVESCRSVRGTSDGAVYRDARWSGGCVVLQRLGNGMLHRQ